MVVCDLDFVGMAVLPVEADTVLIVDANAVLSGSIAFQAFQPIPRWGHQVSQIPSPIDLVKLPSRGVPQAGRAGRTGIPATDSIEYVFGSLVREGAYHGYHYNGVRRGVASCRLLSLLSSLLLVQFPLVLWRPTPMTKPLLLLLAPILLTACVSVSTTEKPPASPARRVISTPNAPAAIAAYSQGIQVGDTLWVAGQIGLDPATREIVPGGIREETRRALENCKAILEAAGFSLKDVAQVQVLLADINDYQAMNEVYVTYFPEDPPARAAYAVAAIPREARVEVIMTAARRR